MLGPVLETLIGGLLTGVLYALVALGFVLIFKASGVFNFAQAAMVLFAALSLARLSEFMPLVLALALSILIMIALAYAIEFLVLRHLVNQAGIILFMATLGIAYFLEGFGQTLWGSDIYKIGLGLPTYTPNPSGGRILEFARIADEGGTVAVPPSEDLPGRGRNPLVRETATGRRRGRGSSPRRRRPACRPRGRAARAPGSASPGSGRAPPGRGAAPAGR